MQISLNSRLRKLTFGTTCLTTIAFYLGVIGHHYLAVRLATQPDPGSLESAAILEPYNAEPRWKLGRYFLFVSQDPMKAIAKLEAAVGLNPHVARYWLDLASAYQVTGDIRRQRSAIDHALLAEPTDPKVAWEAANFYLVQNDVTRAFPLFRLVMENDPADLSPALRLCRRASQETSRMLNEAVPAEPAPYFAFLKLLMEAEETTAAETVWNRLIGLGKPFAFSDASPYFDYLINKHETAHAIQVWQQLVKRNIQLEGYSQPGNLIVDGDLEKDFLNGGFDWRYTVIDPVQLSFDTSEFNNGNQSLRMVFKGPAVADVGIFEYVPVEPNTRYRFSVYTKAQDIESASGPRLSVGDVYSGQSYVLTDDSLGTTGWREQMGDFRTGAGTVLLIVKVTRVPGYPLIKGKFWIDNLKLVQH
jgi:hypothetical protein